MSKAAYLLLAPIFAIAIACSANNPNSTGLDENNGKSGNGSAARNGTGGKGSGTGGNGGGIGRIVPATCGDGKVNPGEECDDGAKNGGDGCTAGCRIEADWVCPPEGGACTSTGICGNGILNTTEGCDDGTPGGGDGCAADCSAVEPGWQCRLAGKPCVPFCGDSQMIGSELCDDGNTNNDDGCSSTCVVEPGSSCTLAMAGMPSVCTKAQCGNGAKETGEGCDAGMLNGLFTGDPGNPGCSKTCTLEPNCRSTDGCTSVCGDGNVDTTAGEQCDDGNAIVGDGCSDTCMLEGGFTCTDMPNTDLQPCATGSGDCLVLPITFRDFDGQGQANAHPDFFFLGGTTTCVPNASGRTVGTNGTCWDSDSTPLCKGIAKDTLSATGKPELGTTTTCACRFTDWDNSGLIGSTNTCSDAGGNPRNRQESMVKVVKDAASFGQWYADSASSTKVVSTIELAPLGVDFQFSSSNGRTVYTDLHDIFMSTTIPATNGAPANTLSSGFFPLEMQTAVGGTKLCNLWPYWTVGTGPCVADDGNPVWQQWDPQGSGEAGVAGDGGRVVPVDGVERNFYFTSEIRYLFNYTGSGSLAFYGDDDVWVYINNKLVLDLGAPHERLQGTITMTGADAAWTILTTDISGAAVPPTTGGSGTVPLGLVTGKTYEIVVFHADRHPRESNYQLTLSAFPTTKTSCEPRCGDAVTTAGEECDLGDGMNLPADQAYNGCTTECKWGPYCGDNAVNGTEECDLGNMNTSRYGAEGCAADCTKPSLCGDNVIDGEFGEDCDDGTANGSAASQCDTMCKLIPL